jgi:hypothetical protein
MHSLDLRKLSVLFVLLGVFSVKAFAESTINCPPEQIDMLD